jgi:hypothetical protein
MTAGAHASSDKPQNATVTAAVRLEVRNKNVLVLTSCFRSPDDASTTFIAWYKGNGSTLVEAMK